jgi:hypothetical protein
MFDDLDKHKKGVMQASRLIAFFTKLLPDVLEDQLQDMVRSMCSKHKTTTLVTKIEFIQFFSEIDSKSRNFRQLSPKLPVVQQVKHQRPQTANATKVVISRFTKRPSHPRPVQNALSTDDSSVDDDSLIKLMKDDREYRRKEAADLHSKVAENLQSAVQSIRPYLPGSDENNESKPKLLGSIQTPNFINELLMQKSNLRKVEIERKL